MNQKLIKAKNVELDMRILEFFKHTRCLHFPSTMQVNASLLALYSMQDNIYTTLVQPWKK